MLSIGSDLAQAIRQLRRHPGFTLVAVATLALGIGASTSVFTVVEAVLIRPLPLPRPDRLYLVGQLEQDGTAGNVGWATVQDWKRRAASIDIAAYRTWGPTLQGEAEAERLAGLRVSWNFFEMLGVQPSLGRAFAEYEDAPETSLVVLLSDALWRRAFAADPEVVGGAVRLNGRDYTVLGVMGPDFEPLVSELYSEPAELWAPIGYDDTLPWACRTCQHLQSIGRLRDGVAATQARAELDTIQSDLRTRFPDKYTRQRMTLVPFQEQYTGRPRPALAALAVAVALVLLIACANVASLMLARAVERERELAIRAALGASRARLARLVAIECGVLAGVAGFVGLTLATWSVDALVAWLPVPLPGLATVGLERSLGLIALATTTIAGILVALVPAGRATGAGAMETLRHSFQLSSGRGHQLVRRALVVGNVALAFVLLSAAGLLLASVYRLLDVDPGFDPRGVLTARLSFLGPRWAEDESVRLAGRELLERVAALPGVESAALAGQIPLGGNRDRWGLELEERAFDTDSQPSAERYSVTAGYFDLLGIPVRRGRDIEPTDDAEAEKVLVVSSRAADTLWPSEDPLGQRVHLGGSSDDWHTVVGIVGDVHHDAVGEAPHPQIYLAQDQVTDSYLTLLVRTESDPASLTGAIRAAVAEIAKGVPVYDVAVMQERVARTLAGRQVLLRLIAIFATVGLVLSIVGLHGVLAFAVARRSREIGIRVALGASRAEVVRLVFVSGMGVVALGAALGALASGALGGLLSDLLFGVEAGNVSIRALGLAVLVIAALPAHALPAWRAARIDPGSTLRAE